MSERYFKCAIICGVAVLLAGCGLFGKDKLDIEGHRINVIKENADLSPDYRRGEVKIKLPAPYANNKWTQNGGNAIHLMGHLASNVELKEIWNNSFGEGSSKRNYLIAAPVVAYKVVFTIDAEGIVSAFRLDNGKKIWKKRLKPSNREDRNISMKGAGLAEFNKKIYATTGFGGVFCLDMTTGDILWRKELEMPIRIAPTVASAKVFVQTIDNTIIALNADNGDELWKNATDVESTTLVGGASPAYNPDMDVLISAFSNGELRAFKASTGTPLWGDRLISKKRTNALAGITAFKANPVIDGDKVFAVGHDSILAAIDLRTGRRLWEREIGSNNQPWISGNYLYVLTNDFDLIALNKNNGKIIWNTTLPTGEDLENRDGIFGTGPLLSSDRLLVATSNGYVFAVSPYTGDVISYISVDEGVELSPVMADGTLILTTKDADIIAYQ